MSLSRPRFYLAICMAFITWSAWGIPAAHAFRVSPVVIDVDAVPGTSAKGQLQITNTSDASRTYYISIQKFVAKGEEGQQDFLPESDVSGLASWIIPERPRVTLLPNETVAFGYTVNVPADAEPGGHYAALFFSDQPFAEGETFIGVGAKVGVLFLVRVPGTIKEDAHIESFRISNGESFSHLPIFFELRIRNLGNVHFRPEGSVVIKNMFGSTAATVPVNPEGDAVLPNSIRRLVTGWDTHQPLTEDGFFGELKNEWSHFAFGRYTAEVDASYGFARLPLHATVTFWVIPWRLLLVGFAALFLFLVVINGYNRLVVRSAVSRSDARNNPK